MISPDTTGKPGKRHTHDWRYWKTEGDKKWIYMIYKCSGCGDTKKIAERR